MSAQPHFTASLLKNARSYHEQLVRRTMAVFYGQVKDETFRRQMKESRKIEDLILMFATNATNVLKKEPSLSGDGWKLELNNHIALFIRMLRDCMKNVSHVSPEVTSRLDMYSAKLAPSQKTYSDSGYDSSSTRDSMSSQKRISMNVVDMTLVLTAARIFKLADHVVQKEIDELSKTCTEKASISCIAIGCYTNFVFFITGSTCRLEGLLPVLGPISQPQTDGILLRHV